MISQFMSLLKTELEKDFFGWGVGRVGFFVLFCFCKTDLKECSNVNRNYCEIIKPML